ncbi:hypothetical protein YDYSG_69080 [Paenibacillus tyrfis]|uniref:DUF4279 domain-containing protein n=1 Tax=Paenibacillus tyrfis TaxID=1501230 RepID=UPI00248FD22A|nr:DUF4279 domain-containing protein [Paenibacillus tyrfis]GLI10872.1 hypothetical protein YDYSG_69080 [Paenibacillus tyrfis]
MNKTNVLVKFIITGDRFPIDEITEKLKVQPKAFFLKGQKGKYVERKETSWYISTEYEESLDINDQLNKIIDLLINRRNELVDLKIKYQLSYLFSIVINIKEKQAPAVYLEQDVIEFANYIKAEFDIDLYIS